jgi:zinc D-Ala-D-Ala carboxypeptidase
MKANWNLYPNFSKEEFDCNHTGKNEMQHSAMSKLQALRTAYGKPINITSGYRHPSHPIEAKKKKPGAHSTGLAFDIACSHVEAYNILTIALALGFSGIGISQTGSGRFIHLDTIESNPDQPRPHVWSY